MDVLKILKKCEIRVVRVTNNNAICHCPFHDDKNPSFSVNIKNGLWICYSGCGKGNLSTLLRKLNKKDINVGNFDLFAQLVHEDIDKFAIADDVNLLKTNSFIGYPRISIPCYLQHRLKKETIIHFGLGEFIDIEKYEGRVIIPIYMSGEIVGFQSRSYVGDPKRYLNPFGQKLNYLLFGYDGIDSREVIIVEGVFDAMRNWERRDKIGFPTVSILGSTLHEQQIDLLIERGVKTLILSLDNDSKSRTGKKKTIEILKKCSSYFNIDVVALPPDEDPSDMQDEEYVSRIQRRKNYNQWKARELESNSELSRYFFSK